MVLPHFCSAAEVSRRLAVGTTYIGGQIHWGFAEKWALEARVLKGEHESGSGEGTVTARVFGLRCYRYFRAPSRVRLYMGVEGASTRSTSSRTDYETYGVAAGAFGGTEMYLLKRLSLGVDVGPYLLSSRVRDSNTKDGEISIVINTFMNFYFL